MPKQTSRLNPPFSVSVKRSNPYKSKFCYERLEAFHHESRKSAQIYELATS